METPIPDCIPDRIPRHDGHDIVTKARGLGDLALAMLLSLITSEHCLVQTEACNLGSTVDALEEISTHVFGLSHVCLNCSEDTTIDEFGRAMIGSAKTTEEVVGKQSRDEEYASLHSLKTTANVIVLRDLSVTSQVFQTQILEIIRTRQVLINFETYKVPDTFLLLPLVSISSRPLSKHLNGFIFISHRHLICTEKGSIPLDPDYGPKELKNRQTVKKEHHRRNTIITSSDLFYLSQQIQTIFMSVETKRYLTNFVVFLRMHRAVASGVTAKATRYLECLTKCLALLHNLTFATPSLVALAARKIYSHRLQIISADCERSLQYGSNAVAVSEALLGVTPDTIIDEVLQDVDAPL